MEAIQVLPTSDFHHLPGFGSFAVRGQLNQVLDRCMDSGADWFLSGVDDVDLAQGTIRAKRAAQQGLNELEPGDVILVKASRAEHLEVLAEHIESGWSKNSVETEEGEKA